MAAHEIGSRHVAAKAWPGPEDALTRAVRGPWRAIIWEIVNKAGWSRDLWKCRHRHRSTEEAFACGLARLAAAKALPEAVR